MTEEFPDADYRCKESGLTDFAFARFSSMCGAVLAGVNTDDYVEFFRQRGLGDNLRRIVDKVTAHVKICTPCRKEYDECLGGGGLEAYAYFHELGKTDFLQDYDGAELRN